MDRVYIDAAIIGGGAAGLAAGVILGRESNCSAIILEHGPRTGKKLAATGNGRCNLSHAPLLSDKIRYHGERALARRIIETSRRPEEFFKQLGLLCRADDEGRVYPYSNTASSVIDALRLSLAKSGVQELCEFTAVRLEPLMEGFLIHSDNPGNPQIAARRVIIAAGGKSQSHCNGYALLRGLGINITPLYPSLCPVKTDEKLTRALKNLRVKARVTVKINGERLAAETGEVQFGADYLSGIAVFNLSRHAFGEKGGEAVFSLDLTPDMNHDALSAYIENVVKERCNAPLFDLLTGIVPKRIGEVLIKIITSKPQNAECKTLSHEEKKRLVKLIKNWCFPVKILAEKDIPNEIWQSSQATSGGITADELCDNLALKKYPHMFAAGEVINVTGDCGGYNLAWAWLCGIKAARSVIADLKNKRGQS